MELKVEDFSLDSTLTSGQTFFWRKLDDFWVTSFDKPVKIKQDHDRLEYYGCTEEYIRKLLGLKDDISSIKTELDKDDFIDRAINYSTGLRVVNEGLWPATLGFILSIQSNVPLIQRRVIALSEAYGEAKEMEGSKIYSFPDYVKIFESGIDKLKCFKLGFRTRFVMSAAEYFYKHNMSESLPLEDIKKRLLDIDGIGDKVLDCVMLYGMHDLSAFPMDVWILRVIDKYYSKLIRAAKSYKSKREIMTSYFGKYAGYAQLFMYNYSRLNST
ncbi:MAG: hypothetical protein M1433_02350 [Candidatus Parvarchaeota archaeon]|nr:hypothetical protein [Candidatus Parvarchaeota archaeon]